MTHTLTVRSVVFAQALVNFINTAQARAAIGAGFQRRSNHDLVAQGQHGGMVELRGSGADAAAVP